jgi:hypothetical protein
LVSLAAASFLFSPAAHAGYIYDFQSNGQFNFEWGPAVFEWSVEAPTLLTESTSFSTFLSTNVNGCTISASIDNPLSSPPPFGPSVVTNFGGESFGGVPCHGSLTQGFPASFSSPGTYMVSNPLATASMDITFSTVPEPATLSLLTVGLLALTGLALSGRRSAKTVRFFGRLPFEPS